MPVEVDPEVGGEDESDAAALLECGFLFVGGEIGAYEGGVGAVEGGGKTVRGAVVGGRTLITAEMRATLVANMCDKFPQLTEEKADRGVSQMLAFLAACNYAGRPLSPSPLVDAITLAG